MPATLPESAYELSVYVTIHGRALLPLDGGAQRLMLASQECRLEAHLSEHDERDEEEPDDGADNRERLL